MTQISASQHLPVKSYGFQNLPCVRTLNHSPPHHDVVGVVKVAPPLSDELCHVLHVPAHPLNVSRVHIWITCVSCDDHVIQVHGH